MPDILIAFGPSDEEEPIRPNEIEPFLDSILQGEKPRRDPKTKKILEPSSLRCHVMANAWVLRVSQSTIDQVAQYLEQSLPQTRPVIVAETTGEWVPLNGAISASKCFTF